VFRPVLHESSICSSRMIRSSVAKCTLA
jgi:hypothetical protein